MNIVIVGWYGTETIGDRAILAGILYLIQNQLKRPVHYHLGSLFPFYTERTTAEDDAFFKRLMPEGGSDIKLSIFDSKNLRQLEQAIDKSDWVIMGGGPLMHLNALFMVEYALKYGRKKGKKTFVMGCGIGPLHKKRHHKAVNNILEAADAVVLRSRLALNTLQHISTNTRSKLEQKCGYSFDPAVACMNRWEELETGETVKTKRITINIRSFPKEYSKEQLHTEVNTSLYEMVSELAEQFPEYEMLLLPMHYFDVGGDDRDIMNKFAIEAGKKNLKVQNLPLNLEDTINAYRDSEICVGMRFHSVVLQTFANHNNFIIDYTQPNTGKTSGFLNELGEAQPAWQEFYQKRYINLQEKPQGWRELIGLMQDSRPYANQLPDLNDQFAPYYEAMKKLGI